MQPIRVFIMYDCSLLCEGVRSVLSKDERLEILGEACNATDTVTRCMLRPPDILIFDIGLPEGYFGTLAPLRQINHPIRFLALMTAVDRYRIRTAADFGVHGYICNDTTPDQLHQAISTVHSGCLFIGPAVGREMMEMVRTLPDQTFRTSDDRYNSLTKREQTVFAMLADGRSNKEIAYALRISRKTVETHHQHIVRKLRINDPVGLVRYAASIGLIDLHHPPAQLDQV